MLAHRLPTCSLLLLLSSVAAAAPWQTDVFVEEPAGVARQREPISGGIPLPPRQFRKDQPFALFTDDGREVPCQVTPLVVETDDTLRWVLVDFCDDLNAGATERFVFRAVAPRLKFQSALAVDDAADHLTIHTGRLVLRIANHKPFALFDKVALDKQPVAAGEAASYTQLHGRNGWDDKRPWQERRLTAAPPDSVRVVYHGPLRTTVEVRGRFADDPAGAGYIAWITTWAGSTRVAVKYKLCNSNAEQYTALPVTSSQITLRLTRADNIVLGAKKPIETRRDGWLHQGLRLFDNYQDIAGAVKAGSGGETLWTGNGPSERPGGWIAAGGKQPVFALDRLFSTNPARRLAVTDGKLVLEGIAPRFTGPKNAKSGKDRRVGEPWTSEACWLFDCSHHTSEYVFDFAVPADPEKLEELARAAHARPWLRAAPRHYSDTESTGIGRFGTLDDETAAYRAWGWKFDESQLPKPRPQPPGAFVAWEDNHYESEADSAQGLLLMYLRTGHRGWFDEGEAWARYHMDLQAWRTDGWRWKDGAIWFPQGGPQGNRRARKDWNFTWGPDWGPRQGNADCRDLWHLAQAKSCYCHYYGSGLADYYCLTGDTDALAAAIDNVEQKDEEFRRARTLVPGKSGISEIRGFGRGFEVMLRVLQADPKNDFIRDLCRFSADVLWRSPLLDERGFHCSGVGAEHGLDAKAITPPIKQWMDEQGISFTVRGGKVDTLTKGSESWPIHSFGGTWQHVYVQNGAEQMARYLSDENMGDFAAAFGQMSARFMLSPKCHQTWYYTYFDVPARGQVFDPWQFEHKDTEDGLGCVHSGWYTCFYPDACAKAYSLTGDAKLLTRAREFWDHGSKREYQTKQPKAGREAVNHFARHIPPKEDSVLSTARLFYETAHPRGDQKPPAAVTDLKVTRLDDGRYEARWTAPRDEGGGRAVRYQLKAAERPIVDYDAWEFARDDGQRRNWWRAENLSGEPTPAAPGTAETCIVRDAPAAAKLNFVLRSYDDSGNASPLSNVVLVE